MQNNPLLSVAIPTKNRYEYLKVLIDKLLTYNSDEFEIIIQDNSEDNSDFLPFIEKYQDPRLIYNHVGEWLSVVGNCDLALSACSGEYICMLGDDDGIVLSESLLLLKELKERGVEAAVINKANYDWPDTSHAVWKESLSGKINIKTFTRAISSINVQSALQIVLNQAGSRGLGSLPRVYHAFVSKHSLDDLKNKTGSYFPGPSPDMANAVGLASVVENCVKVDTPCVISGHCKKSTGGQGGLKEHHGSIEKQGHLPKDTASKWSDKIPFFWSGPTIYAESVKRALEDTLPNKMSELNFDYLYAFCLVFEKHYRSEVLNKMFLGKSILGKLGVFLKVGYHYISIFLFRVRTFIKNYYKHKFAKTQGIAASDIALCIDKVENVIRQQRKSKAS